MQNFTLAANIRDNKKNSARAERQKNRVPGVLYGNNIEKPVSISVDYSDILKTYRKASTTNLIDLQIDNKSTKVLIHELKLEPVSGDIEHIDFYAVNLEKKTTVEVPLEFTGESPAVKNFGGVFMAKYNKVSIRCLPTEIPKKIVIDISQFENIHDHLCAKDLPLGDNLELMDLNPEIVICAIIGHSTEEEEKKEEGITEESEGTEKEKSKDEDKKDSGDKK